MFCAVSACMNVCSYSVHAGLTRGVLAASFVLLFAALKESSTSVLDLVILQEES